MLRTSTEVIDNLHNLAVDFQSIEDVASKGGDISLMLPVLASHYTLDLVELKSIQFGTVDTAANPMQ